MLRWLLILAVACGGSSRSSSQPSVDKLDNPIANAPGTPAPGSQAAIAAERNTEGIRELEAGHLDVAMQKLKEAVARWPEPTYFYNLCIAVYRAGKLDEAFIACHAVPLNNPPPDLNNRAKQAIELIRVEAKRRNIFLDPGGDALGPEQPM